jgi:LuxR family maltose regulon positive regulatory protein
MARIQAARGDLSGAIALLEEAERVYVRGPLPRTRPVAATRARVRSRQGLLSDARAWAEERGAAADDPITYLGEYEALTLARVWIAGRSSGELELAIGILKRTAAAAEAGGRTGSWIEALMLVSLARGAAGDVRGALGPLGRALTLAEPEGFLRIFVDEGEPMRELLRHALARGVVPDATARVLGAFESVGAPEVGARAKGPAGEALLLTPKELVVLRLIAEGLRNQEMARHLFISPATVKRHVANLYAKLGVGHRTEALVRAKELDLL